MIRILSPHPESPLRNRALMAISLSVAVSFTGVGMVLPVRVLYAQSRGASLAIIGAMASSFLLSNFVFQYPTGHLADLFGRKRMMVFGLAAQAGISLLWLTVTDPVVFVVVRFLEGVFAASMLPAARALVADTVPEERRGEAYGIFGACMNAGFLLGPALGGLFAVFGYTSAFVGSCIFRVAALVVVLTLVPRGVRVHAVARARARAVPRRAMFTLALVGTYILYFGDNLYFGFDLTLMPLWMRNHLGASVAVIGLAYVLWAIPSMLVAPFGGRLADRRRRSTLILIFGLAQAPIYIAYGLFTTLIPIFVLWTVHAAVYSLMQPVVDATLATASPPEARARTQSIYSTVGLAGAFLSANVLSVLYGINFRLPLFVMGAGFGVCVLVGGPMIRIAERRGHAVTGRSPVAAAE